MMPGPTAGEEPRWNRVPRIARPGTGGLLRGRRRADIAEAGYMEDVGRPGDDPVPRSAARPAPAPRHAHS